MGFLGTSGLTSFNCCSKGQPAYPMDADYAAQARALGGTVVFAHPFPMDPADLETVDQGWPSVGFGRELPIDVALGAVDAIDVLSYSNMTPGDFRVWYDLLNHGFRIPATAGTDACVSRFTDEPPGGYRVYARVGAGAWTYPDWLAAIRRGESFITNGPLVCAFKVAGHPAGDVVTLERAKAGSVFCYVDVRSQWPLPEVEIVVNGEVRGVVRPQSDGRRVTGSVSVPLGGHSAWVAARARKEMPNPFTVGADLLCHTNPVYIDVPGEPLRFHGRDPAYYLVWLDKVWRLAVSRGFASPGDRTRVDTLMKEAWTALAERMAEPGWRGQPELPPPPEDGRNPA
jgi:hypothetical protein